MDNQCNSCGSFSDLGECPRCWVLVCTRCVANHEQGCEQVQKKKALGLGPTVRQVLSSPVVPAVIQGQTNESVSDVVENPTVSEFSIEDAITAVEKEVPYDAPVESPLAVDPQSNVPASLAVEVVVDKPGFFRNLFRQ